MPVWEYKVVLPRLEVDLSRFKAGQAKLKPEPESAADVLNRYGPEFDSIAEVLNRYGQEGWELVAVEMIDYGKGEEQPIAFLKRSVA
jgi:hypothetical protein